MKKKKIIFVLNHFQASDGVARSLIEATNSLDLNKYDITIKPLYKCDTSLKSELNDGIKLEKAFGFYFRGFNKIAKKIPTSILYDKFIGGKYDIEVAFQCDLPTIIIGNSKNHNAVHIAWMHGYKLYPNEYLNYDKVCCVSKFNAEKAKKEMNGTMDDRIICMYNLVDDEKILKLSDEDVNIDFDNDVVNFVSVGRLSAEKGFERLIKIMAQLKAEGHKLNLIIVGDGPERNNLKNTISQLKVNDIVHLVGQDKNPHKYTKKSDALICSSFSEGYSTVCVEAAVLGIPVITTNVPGGEEIIADCEAGLVTEKDDESLKDGIRQVLLNKTLLDDWKEKLKTTSKNFSMVNRKKALTDFFEEISDLSDEKIKRN